MTFLLSWPPSTNSLWRAFKGRNILSAKARKWADTASKELIAQRVRPVKGPISIHIDLCSPTGHPFDLDNRVKAIFDLLVHNGIIEDDGYQTLRQFSVSVGTDFVGARVTIRAISVLREAA